MTGGIINYGTITGNVALGSAKLIFVGDNAKVGGLFPGMVIGMSVLAMAVRWPWVITLNQRHTQRMVQSTRIILLWHQAAAHSSYRKRPIDMHWLRRTMLSVTRAPW